MDVGFRELVRRLDTVHRWQVMKLGVVRSVWVAFALAMVLVLADLLFAFGDDARAGLDGFLIGVTLAVGVASYWKLRRSISRERMVARLVEERHPAFENALVNAIDFETELDGGGREAVSKELMEEAISAAAADVGTVREHAALRPPTFNKELLAGALLAGLLIAGAFLIPRVFFTVAARYVSPYGDHPPYNATALIVEPAGAVVEYGESLRVSVEARGPEPESISLVLREIDGAEREAFSMFDAGEGHYFQTIENIQEDLEYFVRIPRGRSKRYALKVGRTPRIELATVTYTYPEYTRKASESRVLSGEPVKGYRGTKAALSLVSNRPLSGGLLRIGETEIALEREEADTVGAAFTIEAAGEFSATVVDTEGNESNEPFTGNVAIVEDERPEVMISAPGMDSFALPDAEVPILIDADDDLGITKIDIYRSHNGSMDDRKVLYAGDGADAIVNATETLDLADLGVRPGDYIDYYATATDSRPDTPQTASTESFRLQIISFEEYREFAQSQMTATDLKEKYERYLDAMRELAEEQERLEADTAALEEDLAQSGEDGVTPEQAAQLEELAERQNALSEAADELRQDLEKEADEPVIFDVEEAYKEALREFADRVAAANEHMGNAEGEMRKAGEGGSDAKEGASGQSAASLGAAGEQQEKALDQLRQNVEEFEAGIQAANENLEKVTSVMADVEMFKYLYTLEKGLEREAGFYRAMEEPSLEDQVRLKELSERQDEVRQELGTLKEELLLHADELEQLAETQTEKRAVAERPDAVVDRPEKADDTASD